MNLENSDKSTADIKDQAQEPVKNPIGDPRMPVCHNTDDFTESVRNSTNAWHWSNNNAASGDPRAPIPHHTDDFTESVRNSIDAWHWSNN